MLNVLYAQGKNEWDIGHACSCIQLLEVTDCAAMEKGVSMESVLEGQEGQSDSIDSGLCVFLCVSVHACMYMSPSQYLAPD